MATPSTKDNLAPQPEFGKILFNKPCSTCRRRKVKCDRQLPCGTCGKNGTAATCTYDVPREGTPESQQRLQERVARLEREIEELKGMAARGEPLRPPKIPLLSTTPSSFSEYNSIEESMAGDPGIQVDDENVSFYLGPNYWLNIQEYNYEPRHLYRIESDKTGKNPDNMSFVLVRQCLMKTMQSIARRRTGSSPEELGRIVEQTENFLTTKFMSHVVAANPSHAIMLSYYKGSMKSMRLLIHQLHAQRTFGPEPDYRAKYYQECVEILEEMERGENIALQNHWGWLYRWPTTPCLIYNVLIGLRDQSNHPITDRAWRQINVVFRRHNNEDISMRKFAAWRVIEELCEEAIHYHKQRSHQGAWYTHRLDALGPTSTAKGKETLSLENATVDDILGDVRMFGQPSASHTAVMGGPGYFAAQPVLQPMSFTSWGQPPQATVPSQYPTNADSDDEEEDDDDDEEM
ncbi:hypothetical protein COL154_012882 [Colletotrichum chrysophilum]|nr:hypothetical protein COL154_012882 [Colletotrichum chrysophilum]